MQRRGVLIEPPRPAAQTRQRRRLRRRPWATGKPRFWPVQKPGDLVAVDTKQVRPAGGVVVARGRGSIASARPTRRVRNGRHCIGCWVALAGFVSKPRYMNAEAVKIIAHPERNADGRSLELLVTDKIRSLIAKPGAASAPSFVTGIKSGRRRYLCRVFYVSSSRRKDQKPAAAVLLERSAVSTSLLEMANEFQLTPRERETVQLLAQGLTSQQIASRMGISSNTVKRFLHLVMVKTGSTTPSGIIGRFLQSRTRKSSAA